MSALNVIEVEVVSTPLLNKSGALCHFVVLGKGSQQELYRSRKTRLERLVWTGDTFGITTDVWVDFFRAKTEKVF